MIKYGLKGLPISMIMVDNYTITTKQSRVSVIEIEGGIMTIHFSLDHGKMN